MVVAAAKVSEYHETAEKMENEEVKWNEWAPNAKHAYIWGRRWLLICKFTNLRIISMDLNVRSVAFHRELQINLLHPNCIRKLQLTRCKKTALNLIMDLFLVFGTVENKHFSLRKCTERAQFLSISKTFSCRFCINGCPFRCRCSLLCTLEQTKNWPNF